MTQAVPITLAKPPLRKSTYAGLCDIVYASSGIVLGPRKEALVAARVGRRMNTLGLRDYDEYLRLVSRDRDEVVGLVDAVSTNVTGFFREPHSIDQVVRATRQQYADGAREFRFWSAACSTGEEPYSLAMALREVLPLDARIRILATDISTQALRRCREGIYSANEMEPVSTERRNQWFVHVETEQGPAWQLKPIITSLVSFRRMNLAATPFQMSGPFDAILCRNVMIYFDEHVRSGILAESERMLKPGGLLVTGHAEGMGRRMGGFEYVRPSVYQKA